MNFNLEYDSVVEKNYMFSTNDAENDKFKLNDAENDEFLEPRDMDDQDELSVEAFYTYPCCENKCNEIIPMKEAIKQRLNFMELNKSEQDLVILSHLQSCHTLESIKYNEDSTPVSERETKSDRQYVQYFFATLKICRNMYLFLHNMGLKRYKNIINYYHDYGLSVREYELKNKLSPRDNVLTSIDIENVVTFLKTYASKFAIPLPGRLPQCRNFEKVVKLPSSDSKLEMFRKYSDAASDDKEMRIVGRTSFFKIWNDFCPEIMTMKPASDLCTTCRENTLKLANLSNLPIEEQGKLLEISMKHLEDAKQQREFYNLHRDKAKDKNVSSLLVLSFDFAQNVSYPSSPQQVGSSYFKANRKCGLFGINDEATHIQTNFTIDEEDNVGKGANAVISMLDYYFNNNVVENLVLFADNCVGQNKNNALLHYLLWRVMGKLNKSIELNFLLTGHTKFSPDRNFGIVKTKFSKSNVDCHEDFIEVINASSPNKFNVAVPSKDPKTKTRNVFWAQWDKYLQQLFKSIPSISKYHHFKFYEDGSIRAKLFANSEEVELRKATSINAEVSPLNFIEPDGITKQRAWYLFKEIRPLCYKECCKDLVAPQPSMPETESNQKNAEETSADSVGRKKMLDHRKQRKNHRKL